MNTEGQIYLQSGPLLGSSLQQSKDRIPRVQHLAYLQVVLEEVLNQKPFDEIRSELRIAAHDISRRTHSDLLPSRLSDAYTFWNPATQTLSELMRLGLVQKHPLPSKRLAVDNYREKVFALTPGGIELCDRLKREPGSFLKVITPILLKEHPFLRKFLETLIEGPIFIPEYSEEDIQNFLDGEGPWVERVAKDAVEKMQSTMSTECSDKESVSQRIKGALDKRFGAIEGISKNAIKATLNDSLATLSTEARSISMDCVTLDVLSAWASQLLLCNFSRYVHGFPSGQLIWSTADIQNNLSGSVVIRRGMASFGEAISLALLKSYRDLADEKSRQSKSSAKYPYIEIFKIRALTAYRLGVNDVLVDKVIAEIRDGLRPAPYRIELAVGGGRWQAVSERPFWIGSQRYYVMLIKPEGEKNES